MFYGIRDKRRKKVYHDKWDAFYKKEEEILEFIIRDFRMKCPEDKTPH